ncbi:carbonic anhydrase [Streptomyces sp. NPDC006367]|uniref:carbonic anhydrase n=1 Tax=Streptomyces sp. NPDC006367 TaxID=3156759 RepID=UPI0033A59D61
MQSLIDHARTFGRRPEEFAGHAEGRSPEVLFLTCSDSRVVPALITGARPGRLFEPRTAGGIVPPYGTGRPSGEPATAEYAVGALVRGDGLSAVPAVPAVRDWPAHAGTVRGHRADTDAFETLRGAP